MITETDLPRRWRKTRGPRIFHKTSPLQYQSQIRQAEPCSELSERKSQEPEPSLPPAPSSSGINQRRPIQAALSIPPCQISLGRPSLSPLSGFVSVCKTTVSCSNVEVTCTVFFLVNVHSGFSVICMKN